MTSRQARSEYARVAGPAVGRVAHAIRRGLLVRQPCEDCGAERTQAHHHNGYDEAHALDVVWLCPRHHMARHRRSMKPTWEHHTREYIARTRAGVPGKYHQFSAASGPKRLMIVLEKLWGCLMTDEERDYAFALVVRLRDRDAAEREASA